MSELSNLVYENINNVRYLEAYSWPLTNVFIIRNISAFEGLTVLEINERVDIPNKTLNINALYNLSHLTMKNIELDVLIMNKLTNLKSISSDNSYCKYSCDLPKSIKSVSIHDGYNDYLMSDYVKTLELYGVNERLLYKLNIKTTYEIYYEPKVISCKLINKLPNAVILTVNLERVDYKLLRNGFYNAIKNYAIVNLRIRHKDLHNKEVKSQIYEPGNLVIICE